MEFGGYAGNILHVSLTDGTVRKQPLDAGLVKTFIGGAGINLKLARDLIPPDVDPLSPKNAIIIGTGPFNGTFIPGASQTMSICKSPLNGSFAQSSGSGNFSHFLKSSGYDHLVITGRSPWPVYLLIKDDDIQLKHASDIWGIDTYDATDELRGRHSPCSIIPIGQAGERQVAISITQIDKGDTIGSGGLAAVMGSKNLKAIVACGGSRTVEVADPVRLQRLTDALLEKINGYQPRDEILKNGAMTTLPGAMAPGIVARNSSEFISYPADINEIETQLYELHKASRRKIACATCPMADLDRVDLPGVRTIYDAAVSLEMAALTSSQALAYVKKSAVAHKYAMAMQYYDDINRAGLDRTYSFQGLADFVITLYERGIINSRDTGGIELDRSYDTILKLVKSISMREGLGNMLADGAVKTAQRLGASEHLQNVIKGQFVPIDPRVSGFLPLHLGMMVHPGLPQVESATIGATPYSPSRQIADIAKQAERYGVPAGDTERLFSGGGLSIGLLTMHTEAFFGLFPMLGQCHRPYISQFYSLGALAELYSAVTGVETTAANLKRSSAQVWNMWHELNESTGFTRQDDLPPDIWFNPLKGQDKDYALQDYFLSRQLSKSEILSYLDDYYAERGI